jgi:hypothetical protein
MDKYAAEKIASDYYTVGVQLALQNLSGDGHTKTASNSRLARMLGFAAPAPAASKGKEIAKMLGLAGAGAGAGALGMRHMTPEISNVLAKMTPSELAVVAKNVGGQRLAKADEVTQKIVSNLSAKQMEPGLLDSTKWLDGYDRLAMSAQALKNMVTDPMNTLKALSLAGQDGAQGLKMTAESIAGNPKVQQTLQAATGAARQGSEHMSSAKPMILDAL